MNYQGEWIEFVPETSVESFAGTGDPVAMGRLNSGEHVLDVGCGAGFDSLIASHMVGSEGHVTGIDVIISNGVFNLIPAKVTAVRQ